LAESRAAAPIIPMAVVLLVMVVALVVAPIVKTYMPMVAAEQVVTVVMVVMLIIMLLGIQVPVEAAEQVVMVVDFLVIAAAVAVALVFLARVQMVLAVYIQMAPVAEEDQEDLAVNQVHLVEMVEILAVEEDNDPLVLQVEAVAVQFALSGQVLIDNSLQQILEMFSNEFQYQN